MQFGLKWVAHCVLGLCFIGASEVNCADRGDVYLLGGLGFNLESSAEVYSSVNTGYLVTDGLGFGINFDQHFSLVDTRRFSQGIGMGPEFRWFLEPIEFSGAVEYFLRTYTDIASGLRLIGTGSYLFAMTSAMAMRIDLKFQRDFETDKNIFYGGLGLRFIF